MHLKWVGNRDIPYRCSSRCPKVIIPNIFNINYNCDNEQQLAVFIRRRCPRGVGDVIGDDVGTHHAFSAFTSLDGRKRKCLSFVQINRYLLSHAFPRVMVYFLSLFLSPTPLPLSSSLPHSLFLFITFFSKITIPTHMSH